MAERTSEIVIGGKKVILLNFANMNDVPEALAAIDHAQKFIARYPPSSVLTLTDCSNSTANEKVVEGLKQLSKANKPFVKRCCSRY